MNKTLRKLSSLFGGSPIPVAGRNARLDMDRHLIRETVFRQTRGFAQLKKARRGTFVHVVKAGFKTSVVRTFGYEIVVENKYLKQG